MSLCPIYARARQEMISRDLSRRPRGYDFDSEVLVSLPLASPCNIRQLAKDFGVPTNTVLNALGRLGERFGILVCGNTAEVLPGGKTAIKAASEAYWSRVWERNLN